MVPQRRPRRAVLYSHHLLMGLTNATSDLLPGTLELLILKALQARPAHGYAIVEHLRRASDDALHVGESALYPALARLLVDGWVTSEWGISENNRRAKFYSLTPAGRRHLANERREFARMTGLVQRILEA